MLPTIGPAITVTTGIGAIVTGLLMTIGAALPLLVRRQYPPTRSEPDESQGQAVQPVAGLLTTGGIIVTTAGVAFLVLAAVFDFTLPLVLAPAP